jgi:hypothetical protein
MPLSYSFRLVCLALLGVGCAQSLAELAFWFASPRVVKLLGRSGARNQEQFLFWGQIATHAVALLLTVAILVPRYVEAETNLFAERVGILSLAAAVFILFRYLRALQHGLGMWWRAAHLQHLLQSAGIAGSTLGLGLSPGPDQLVMSAPGPCPPVAVVGLLRPRILIARAMLDPSKLSPEGLAIALDHERAHLSHSDNWKLFALTSLPSLGLRTAACPGPVRLWQRYNDWAADDDAIRDNPARALTLAESLVACAKSIPPSEPDFLFTGFAAHEAELEARIERLLDINRLLQAHTSPQPITSRRLMAFLVGAGAVLIPICLLAAIAPWLQEAAETILHLG